jgi:RNA polymerase sigma-70 factor (ECF subfamily)
MSITPPDLTADFPISTTVPTEASAALSDLENEVVILFDQFRIRLLRYVISFGVPAHEGEEIIQEVFLALFRHLRQGKSRANLRGWLFRVAHNLSLKRIQLNYRGQAVVELDDAIAASLVDPAPNPEEQMARSQRQERLRTILYALPKKDQCCLYLRAEGLRYREIAEILNISLGAVSMSLAKSLARMGSADGG